MGGKGRGRGEAAKVGSLQEQEEKERYRGVVRPGTSVPVLDVEEGSSGSSSDNGQMTTKRGRGVYRSTELRTIPEGITKVRVIGNLTGVTSCQIITNFVKISPMGKREVHKYRVDFEPNLESVSLRMRLFRQATKDLFTTRVTFDGMSDARSSASIPGDEATLTVENPQEPSKKVTVKVKKVGNVAWGSFEMVRLYNMHMKSFLRALGFFSVSSSRAYVHEALSNPIGQGDSIMTVRGYKTAANVHEEGQILMNLESVHKLIQKQNVLRYMVEIKNKGGNFHNNLRAALTGKLVVTRYNKQVYRIEDINFNLNPKSEFHDSRNGRQVSYFDYYRSRYDITISDDRQPLLLVVPNNQRSHAQGEDTHEILLIPELCNIAGLTDSQKNDNRLKIDLVRSSQISPKDHVQHLATFLKKLHDNREVKNILSEWGYSYETEPITIRGRCFDRQAIGWGRAAMDLPDRWAKVDNNASFDSLVMKDKLARVPGFPKLGIVVGRSEVQNEGRIITKIRGGMERIGCLPGNVQFYRIQGDSPNHYAREIRSLPSDLSAALVIVGNQNKERYDAIKKMASVERGIITQVVTSKLMLDDRKASGASIKIGIQLAAKLGGEPWYINLPLTQGMICGYDTYHDTAQRGRSYGAFVASMNSKFSRWYSKADSHERLDELSSHLKDNLTIALRKYRELNGNFPDRLIIYRDGVGDGQLEHVYNVEVKDLKKAVAEVDQKIKMSFIVVNKRVGARFYLRTQQGIHNPAPGTVIDDVVTRQERYDFYLISQSTRHGTVAPTYYNVLHDETGLGPDRHQMMAYRLCLNYYNWTGTVRVPAPCQYAHKLALLCGEHLHAVPNVNIDDRLHFL